MRHALRLLAAPLALVLVAAPAVAQLAVVSTSPSSNEGNVAPGADIVVDFDRALAPTTLASGAAAVFGSSTGPAVGAWALEAAGTRARFVSQTPFSAGEIVTVGLSESLTAADATTLRTEGYTFQFQIAARPNQLDLEPLASYVVRSTPSSLVRVYGGQATDLDDDGWLDLAVVTQNASDVRVLMNRADGSGEHDSFLQPTNATGSTPSPNQPADMNGDGIVDIVTANKFGDSVSVLIGNGDGTFQPRVDTPAGDLPRGLAVFDMDGDGDADVAVANALSSELTLFFNDGTGALSPAVSMEGGGAGEWGLAAGDMDEDGVLDLVVGCQMSERVVVWLGNGDGTFTMGGSIDNVDDVWMIVLGDVDGDGDLDASVANGTSNSASILLGDGAGNLTLGQLTPMPAFVVATDLGDLDGDGDLDWVLSSFTGAGYTLMLNDGAGNFSFDRFLPATANGACSLICDVDNDFDLDLILLDEIADEVAVLENVCRSQTFCTGAVNSTSFGAVASITGSCAVAANDLRLHAGPVPDGFGFFFRGQSTQFPQSVGNGYLCLGGTVFRSPVGTAVGNILTVPIDLTGPGAAIVPGSTWLFQAVYRDVAAGGAGFNFSEGIEISFF